MPWSDHLFTTSYAQSGIMTRDALSSSDGKSGAPLGLLSFLAALVLAQQVGSKVVRDALFLAQASAAQLPQAFLFGALLSVPLVLGELAARAR